MHLGVDFDNTLVSYDELFYRCARERHLIPSHLPHTKAAVRGYLWTLPDGNTPWTELQGVVYGPRMGEAVFFPGAREALEFCRQHGIRLSIISHKLEYPALGPRVSLRQAAVDWMEARGFFDPAGLGLSRDAVFFESSREEKLARIARQRCTHFLDDLPEVLDAADFPAGVDKWLFHPSGGEVRVGPDVKVFPSWGEIQRHMETLLA